MKKIIILLLSFLILSCSNTTTYNEENKITLDTNVAVDFINQYIVNIQNKEEIVVWIEKNPLLTKEFKKAYKNFMNNEVPDAPSGDPILNAQDYPSEGFEVKEINKDKGIVIIKGVNWEEFTLNIQLVYVEEKTLVNACGIINQDVKK